MTALASIVPYRSFATSDGAILLGGGNDRLFGILSAVLGHPEWTTQPEYATNSARVANRDALEAAIEAITSGKPTAYWLVAFEGKGMPYAAVNDVKDALEHEQSKARNMVVEVEHGACGTVRLVNTPVKYSDIKPRVRMPPPMLGQHTDEILGQLLGLGQSAIDELRSNGIVK